MTTLRQVVKGTMLLEGITDADPTTFAKTLTDQLNKYGYQIHEKRRCVRLPKSLDEAGREMSPAEQVTLLGKSVDGAETPSTSMTSPAESSS